MTSRTRRPRAQGWALLATAAWLVACPGIARAGGAPDDSSSAAPAESTAFAPLPADSGGTSWIAVETVPPGLRVWINGIDAGPSPIGFRDVPSGRVVVRTFAADLRRFEQVSDGADERVATGDTLIVRLDLRPRVLIGSKPEPAALFLESEGGGAGLPPAATPLRVLPSRLEGARVRLRAAGYADSVLEGATLLERASRADGRVVVALRSLDLPPPAPPPSPSLLGRAWFRWALVGAGAALTGSSAVLRHQGDRAYDRYLASTRPAEIERLYAETERYDRWATTTLAAGQVALTAGIFLLISGLGR